MIAVFAFCVSAAPARADDRVALVGCNLVAQDGPTATFLQIAGESRNRNRGFVVQSNGSASRDVTGRTCAKVLADLVDDGFEFRSANVSGRLLNEWISIWVSND